MLSMPQLLFVGGPDPRTDPTEVLCAVLPELDPAPAAVVLVDDGTDQRSAAIRAQLLAAGALDVLQIPHSPDTPSRDLQESLFRLPAGTPLLCAAPAVREIVTPGATLGDPGDPGVDRELDWRDGVPDLEPLSLGFRRGRWTLRLNAAAVILAGGQSSRMGHCKALLSSEDGRPMIQRTVDGLAPYFDEILISTNRPKTFAFLGRTLIPDTSPGRGPMEGIASSLAAASRDRLFVVACDVPTPDLDLMMDLLRRARGRDGAVPLTPAGHLEPVFAVYSKSLLPRLRDALARGQRRIIRIFEGADLDYPRLPSEGHIVSINRPADYEFWLYHSGPRIR